MSEVPSPLESICGRPDLAAVHLPAGAFELYANGVPDEEGFTAITCQADQILAPLHLEGWSHVTNLSDASSGGMTLIMRKVRQ